MMKKYLLNVLNFVAMPLPYPMAAGWHLILIGSLIWALSGAPLSVSPWQLLQGAAAALIIGAALVILAIRLNKAAEAADDAQDASE